MAAHRQAQRFLSVYDAYLTAKDVTTQRLYIETMEAILRNANKIVVELGDVILEEESSVWYGAVLRGDINRIVIGPRSNIQDNAIVHVDTNYPTSMGELVTVGHTAIVHACTIDNEVLIGMGSIILDDVEVGARSIIGANALVTIGTKIPPGSLVLGSPAKIRRQLSLDEQKDIARWAWSYVETAKHYREFY